MNFKFSHSHGYSLRCESSLTNSMMVLLPVIFGTFVIELWSLIDVRISFPINILRTNRHNLTKFCICIDIDKT